MTRLIPPHPAFVALCVVTALSPLFWWPQRKPDITAKVLLARSERGDAEILSGSNGVAYQAVRISVPGQTMERAIYRDLRGRRRLRLVQMNAEEAQLKTTLLRAGLDWDQPLSASSYQEWHDRQRVREDEVVRAGNHLLTLTTKVTGGAVSRQSITVPDVDFHPVRRMVSFRDAETVEIAETDFQILPWSGLKVDPFEPLGGIGTSAFITPVRELSLPPVPDKISEQQLEETELGTRLILNQLHADTGEQIEIVCRQHEIEVHGVVDTDDRKRALRHQLSILSHLKVVIQSVTELANEPAEKTPSISEATATVGDKPSLFETYLLSGARSVKDANVLTHRLFESVLIVSQETKALDDLRTRFVAEQNTILASATLSELTFNHRERLQAALIQERELLIQVQRTESPKRASDATRLLLTEEASKNLALCKELTQTTGASPRSAGEILDEMTLVVNSLASQARDLRLEPSAEAPQHGKR